MYIEISGQRTFFSNGNGRIDAKQPSVLFIHGAGMDHSVWVMPARYFARHGYNVFAPDLPGHGLSGGSPLPSIPLMADWINEFLNQLNVDICAIAGHSMGSLVGISFAARFKNKTRSLALLGTSTPMTVGPALLDAARANHHDAIDMANTWSHSPAGLQGGNQNPGICMTMSGQRLLERADKDVYFTDLNACNSFTDGDKLAQQIEAKTLVVIGEQDKMTAPIGATKVADYISGSRICLLACGHSMLSEQPNGVLDALKTIV